MKKIFLSVLLFGTSVMAIDQNPAALPKDFNCTEILSITDRMSSPLGKVTIEGLSSVPFSRDTQTEDGHVYQSRNDDQVIINFNDGDQLEFFTFKKEDMAALTAKKMTSIRGLRHQGFGWADGDHTDRLTVLECK